MLWVNETRFLVHRELSNCKCGLNESVCNSKQKWNYEKCRCERKVDDWSCCKDDYMWNPGTYVS